MLRDTRATSQSEETTTRNPSGWQESERLDRAAQVDRLAVAVRQVDLGIGSSHARQLSRRRCPVRSNRSNTALADPQAAAMISGS